MTTPHLALPKNQGDLVAKLIASRIFSEFTGWLISLGTVPAFRAIAPKKLESFYDWVAERYVMPRLKKFDRHVQQWPLFANGDDKSHKEICDLSDKERAKSYAKDLVDNAMMLAPAIAGQIIGFKYGSHGLGFTSNDPRVKKVFDDLENPLGPLGIATVIDKGLEVGSLFFLQEALPRQTTWLQRTLASIIKKTTGFDLGDTAKIVTNWGIADTVGVAGATAYSHRLYHRAMKDLAAKFPSEVHYK